MTRLFAGTQFDIPPTCDVCGKIESDCDCTAEAKALLAEKRQREADRMPPEKQTARISVQKRKGGRKVTVVEGLTAKANDLAELLTKLQAGCGSGGTVKPKEDLIEIQGDHSEKVGRSLRDIGFKTKPK